MTSESPPQPGSDQVDASIVPPDLRAIVSDVIDKATHGEPWIVVTGWNESQQVFRHRDLRQGLYDEGKALMEHVIVNLHGQPHTARRRLENRLFRRDTFQRWERDTIPTIINDLLGPHLKQGAMDLVPFARKAMMRLAVDVAGVDLETGSDEEFEALYALMGKLAQASNVASASAPPAEVIERGNVALDEFDARFFRRSRERREELLRRFRAQEILEDDLPRDVLTTLLGNQDRLELSPEVIIREVAYYPWVGSHSTSNAFAHAMHHVFDSIAADSALRQRLLDDPFLLQRFVHESLRLHPASPITKRRATVATSLASGREVPADHIVIVDLVAANRDPRVFGSDANEFRPERELANDTTPWGLTFGTGFHACLGQELAGGLGPDPDSTPETHLFGAICVLARTLLLHGARVDPATPAQRDRASIRPNWGSYPVVFV